MAAPQTTAAACAAPATSPAKLASAAARTAPVTVQPVPTPAGQQTSMADQVRQAGAGADFKTRDEGSCPLVALLMTPSVCRKQVCSPANRSLD